MHSLLVVAHVPLFKHPHSLQFVPLDAPGHVGVTALKLHPESHATQGPFAALPLMHDPDEAHHPHPVVDAQCCSSPIAAHRGSHGIVTLFVPATLTGARKIGSKCDAHRSTSSKE